MSSLPSGRSEISENDILKVKWEFSYWLRKKRDKNLSELTPEKQLKYFKKFMERWNDAKLSSSFYDGSYAAKEEARHAQRQVIEDTDDSNTASRTMFPTKPTKRRAGPIGPAAPDTATLEEYKRKLAKQDKKKYWEDQKVVMEELVPKATGRDARLEKKKQIRAFHRQREDSPEMKESDVLGGGDDYYAMLAKRRKRQEQRQIEKRHIAQEKISSYQEKEAQRLAQLRELAKAAKQSNSLWKPAD